MTQPQMPTAHLVRPNMTRINVWVDLVLGGLLVGTIVSAYLDKSTHIIFGSTALGGVVLHLGLHWRWIIATTSRLRQIPARTQRSLLLVVLLLLTFIPLLLSGMVVALIYAPQVSAFHTWVFYLFAGLVLTHLILCWRWIIARLRRRR